MHALKNNECKKLCLNENDLSAVKIDERVWYNNVLFEKILIIEKLFCLSQALIYR